MFRALIMAVIFTSQSAMAHNTWSNGQPVPDWVKKSCCGPSDAHLLRPDQVHHEPDLGFYTISGVAGFSENQRIGDQTVIPSQDGQYWLFFGPGYNAANVYCFFVPLGF